MSNTQRATRVGRHGAGVPRGAVRVASRKARRSWLSWWARPGHARGQGRGGGGAKGGGLGLGVHGLGTSSTSAMQIVQLCAPSLRERQRTGKRSMLSRRRWKSAPVTNVRSAPVAPNKIASASNPKASMSSRSARSAAARRVPSRAEEMACGHSADHRQDTAASRTPRRRAQAATRIGIRNCSRRAGDEGCGRRRLWYPVARARGRRRRRGCRCC